MSAPSTPDVRGAHLVGSINLPDAQAVMSTVATHLGERLHRIPDGEVGERYYWIQFQRDRLAATPGIHRVGDPMPALRGQFDPRMLALDEGVQAENLAFPPLGYAEAAKESYATFRQLRESGVIAPGTRFQVSLPTPASVIASFVSPESREALEPAYAKALFGELEEILSALPHEDLAIQWDTAAEFGLLESSRLPAWYPLQPWFANTLDGVIDRAVQQAAAVPEDVEVGYHLCYGDYEEAHFIQPEDARYLAAVMAGVLERSPRPITWFHLPVPIERDDEAYFAPLAQVQVPEETELYLGLLHHEDGVAGAQRRITAAATAQPRFGVATECGFGRGPSERTAPLLELHGAVSAAW
ncbi:hypothetical protein [Psychromicrobium xiongbiense]|uniref:hypothetical protein n=1 Tax=Psychromicrobium xiongbiense TaxID=3051184 RepID=UPI002555B854|nr:hypothetical protein [Psychromicrobium sp. YIM S02556]